METEKEEIRPSLALVLAGQPIGTWVVLDSDMSRILGSAATPEEALRNAGVVDSTFDRVIGERPVVLQVQDPSVICFY